MGTVIDAPMLEHLAKAAEEYRHQMTVQEPQKVAAVADGKNLNG